MVVSAAGTRSVSVCIDASPASIDIFNDTIVYNDYVSFFFTRDVLPKYIKLLTRRFIVSFNVADRLLILCVYAESVDSIDVELSFVVSKNVFSKRSPVHVLQTCRFLSVYVSAGSTCATR